MIKNSDDFLEKAKKSIEEFNVFCEGVHLVDKVKADHIGYKCSSKEDFEYIRNFFEFDGKFVYQSIISNRRIAIIGLHNGVETVAGMLMYLELSDQKPDGSQVDGIDHLEIVPVDISYEELILLVKSKGYIVKEAVRPHHTTYDIVLPSGFIVRLSSEMLVDKIKRSEMV